MNVPGEDVLATMPATDIPRPLQELQHPIQRVLWHELGQVLREHYGDDVLIGQPLTKLTRSSFGEEPIVLEGTADAAIVLRYHWDVSCLRRRQIVEYDDHISLAVGAEFVRDVDVRAWLDDHRDDWRGYIRTGGCI